MSNCLLKFAGRVVVVILQLRDVAANRVQPIRIRLDLLRPLQKILGVGNVVIGHLRLGCGELQTDVMWHCIGCALVKAGGIVEAAIELIGVSHFGDDIRMRIVDGFERIDGFRIISGVAVVAGQRALHVGIVGSAPLCHLQPAIRLIQLLHMFVTDGKQQLGARVGPETLSFGKRIESIIVVTRVDINVGED